MSKISVFKFNINKVDNSKKIIDAIIEEYLEQNGFNYNNDEKCYVIGTPSEKDANINMAINVLSTLEREALDLRQKNMNLYSNLHPCLNYEIVGNQLIIKAYILNAFANIKTYIHSNFNSNMAGKDYYNNLKTNLFNKFQQNNITLVNIETEKVIDGSGTKMFKKTMLILLPFIIVFTIITIMAYLSSR